MAQRVVLRTVFPAADRRDRLPLYLDAPADQPTIAGRHTLHVPVGSRVSLLSYFNAFPAAYWQHASTADAVLLHVRTSGAGTLTVRRSDATGTQHTVQTLAVSGDESVSRFELPLTGFEAGGWYWLDLESADEPLTLESAEWSAPADADSPGSLSVVVTTHNRPDFCVRLLRSLASDAAVAERIDRIFVVDQGTSKVRDDPGFADVAAEHGNRLQLIEQENLGGSGGFSRGMVELLRRNESGYLLLLDDDIELEPEGVRRALQFARYAATPTIVGGHMFDLNAQLTLHAFGEVVDRRTFNWGPPNPEHLRHDFGSGSLAGTDWLHRRVDADFNGWWMCLLPREVLSSIGLSLPYFIKWDDAEFGLRAGEHGFPTVSLPGAAVWHVSWLDKDDSRDWQSYFHSRNRLVSALLHSPKRLGGRVLAESFLLDLKHLLFMHYYAVRLRHEALLDVLQGPGMLERTLRTRLRWAREAAAEFGEMTPVPPEDTTAGALPRDDERVLAPRPSGIGLVGWLLRNATRHLLPVRHGADAHPVALTREEARWWRVPTFDAVLVPLADGSGRALYRRSPSLYRGGIVRSVGLHARVLLSWRRLRRRYQAEAADLAAPASWERYLGLSPAGTVSPDDGTASPAAVSSREIRSS
jgi:galactofuranosylgalactofuranosylrhamnosyl-N-acetylglucosaminyl-diphospho-decaprenol beta-1,5/1,6-galactofuranosyltransferase